MDFIEKACMVERKVDLNRVYSYHLKMLKERIMRIFIYDNLPFPQRELERRLMFAGAAAIVNDGNVGLMVTNGSLSGVTQYDDVFTHVTYAAPTAKGGTLEIGVDAVVCYNDSLMQSLIKHVEVYASLLSHIYLTLRCAAINIRKQDILVVADDATKENVDAWYKGMYEGKPRAIFNDTLGEIADTVVNLQASHPTTGITDLVNSYNDVLRGFYRDIGIRYSKSKAANMVVDEVLSDDQMLLYNIDDMFDQRKQLCDDYNRVFASIAPDISVRINPIFDVLGTPRESEEGGDRE